MPLFGWKCHYDVTCQNDAMLKFKKACNVFLDIVPILGLFINFRQPPFYDYPHYANLPEKFHPHVVTPPPPTVRSVRVKLLQKMVSNGLKWCICLYMAKEGQNLKLMTSLWRHIPKWRQVRIWNCFQWVLRHSFLGLGDNYCQNDIK